MKSFSQDIKIIVVMIALLGAAGIMYARYGNDPMFAVSEGLPQDMPIEKEGIVEDAATHYTEVVDNARQYSVAYKSSKSMEEKYAEFKSYMSRAGYKLKENGTPEAPSIFGMKKDSNLSVVLSNSNGKTLVQIAYLDK